MSETPPARKSLKHKPKAVVRRSKAERDALEKAEQQRKRERETAAAHEAAAAEAARRAQYGITHDSRRGGRGDRGDRGGGGRGGRAGYMGRVRPGVVTRAPVIKSSGGSGYSGGGWGGMGRGGGASGSSSGVKREPGVKRESDADIAMLGIKHDYDDGGYVSSDPEDKGDRLNIDMINLVSEDEEEDEETGEKTKVRRRRIDTVFPIRPERKEHKERTVGVSNDASSAAAAALRKQAEEATKDGKTFDKALAEVTATAEKKGKARLKDVEVTGSSRKWKGVWQPDVDSDEEDLVRVKQEPEDDTTMFGVDPAGPSNTSGKDQEQDMPDATADLLTEDIPNQDVKVKVEKRRSSQRAIQKPTFQSAEEEREWQKQQDDLQTIRTELGEITLVSKPDAPAQTDNAETEEPHVQAETDQLQDRRQDAVYLFQFPPILPDLEAPYVKKEPISPEVRPKDKKPVVGDTANSAIKVEDIDDLAPDSHTSNSRQPKLAAGKAGKLRIHKSGRATLTWGGTVMELNMGSTASFLQSTIMTKVEPKKAEDGDAGPPKMYGGKAVSFGQIRGKLVVTPDWTDILGA